MFIPIIATIIRVLWVSIEWPYLRQYRVQPGKDWDRYSAKLWDVANVLEPIGMILGFAGVGAITGPVNLIEPLGLILLVVGIVIRGQAIWTLGKYFTGTVLIKDDHRLIRTGVYKHLRHPAYAGALLAHLGLGLSFSNWFSLAFSTIPFFIAAAYRMKVEDQALHEAFGVEYRDYSRITKRLIPKFFCLVLVIVIFGHVAFTQEPSKKVGPWRLFWSDEFDYKGLPDPAKWSYDVGGHGWGNQELQYYTEQRKENARVENGNLVIEARRETWQKREYTSTRLVSKGKGDWTYGRVEVRAKLPSGRGTWPAIWMLPSLKSYGNGGWPDNGEIDVMEHVGFDPDVVHGSVHTKAYYHSIGTQKTAKVDVPNARTGFNVYAIEWTPEEIRWYVNNHHYFTFKNERPTNPQADYKQWPFDKPFHLILNVAVGGTWGGAKGVDESIWPQQMVVDYVRVYQGVR